jgi:hypothetical protein
MRATPAIATDKPKAAARSTATACRACRWGRPNPRSGRCYFHCAGDRVAEGEYAWKGAKWVNRLELMVGDRPGFWEERGYSMTAIPWRDDRHRKCSLIWTQTNLSASPN